MRKEDPEDTVFGIVPIAIAIGLSIWSSPEDRITRIR
jgi:hypothetical protein